MEMSILMETCQAAPQHPPPAPQLPSSSVSTGEPFQVLILFFLHLNGECLTVTVLPLTQESEGFINPKKMDEQKPPQKKRKIPLDETVSVSIC